MSEPALETLIYGLKDSGSLGALGVDARGLFVNARAHSDLPHDMQCVQWFKTYADSLEGHGFDVAQRVEDVEGFYDYAFLLFPKNMVEGRYLIAKALEHLHEDGSLFISAENKAGGTRLQKIVQQFGAGIVQQISKYKSRFVQIEKSGISDDHIRECLEEGSFKTIDKTGFKAQAGIYGWDKIDKGSQVLLQHVPHDLKGKLADFGCGYGYLLQHILQHNNAIKQAYAIDADARALHAARENLAQYDNVDYIWGDLTGSENIPSRLDTIIMNPPFHEGKITDSSIGVSFIRTAAKSLKRNGVLYMVANNQLPYEAVLEDAFFSYECIAQDSGFKVFKAVC